MLRGPDIVLMGVWKYLSPSIQRVAHFIAALPGFILSNADLMDLLYRGQQNPPYDTIIGVMICELRKVLRPVFAFINERGRGWMLIFN